MSTNNSWWAKYWKDVLKVATLVFLVFYVAVFAGVWGDRNYTSNFWPNFFKWSAVVVGVGLLIGWIKLWGSNKKQR